MKDILRALASWPLLLLGLLLFTWGVYLAEDTSDSSDARSLLLGVASVLVGAGIARVIYDAHGTVRNPPPNQPEPDSEGEGE